MLSLRLVLDTNIIVSAALNRDGLPATSLLLAMMRPMRLYLSEAILTEYRMVLQRRELHIRKGLRHQLLKRIEDRSYLVFPSRHIRAASDPDDDMFLECADAARADFLVTGNVRHFPRFWKQTKIVTSREFITLIAPHLAP
jgi:putative PIN family toxin of toxin-antitoxin system